jgi:polysaccharide biosynthesis transport protein
MDAFSNGNGQDTDSAQPASPINIRDLIQIAISRAWLIIPMGMAAGLLGYVYVAQLQEKVKYTARAVLQVEQEEKKIVSIEEVTSQDLRATEVLNTIVANVKNSSVMLRVVRAHSLTNDPAFVPAGRSGITEMAASRKLNALVTCKLRKDTRLIDISVDHENADLAKKLVNSVAQEFIRENLDQRFSTTKAANELLFDEAAKLKVKLEKSERNLQDYREQKQSVSMEDKQNMVLEKLTSINRSYTEAKAARFQLEADVNQVKKASNRVDVLLAIPSILNDSTVADLRKKAIEKEAEVKTLTFRYKAKHPSMIQAQRELQELSDALSRQVLAYPKAILAAYDGALAREKLLESALHSAQVEALELDRNAIGYHVFLREVESDRALYEAVLKRLKETDLTKGLEKQSIAIIEAATMASPTSVPSKPMVIAVAGIAGAAGTLGLFVLLRLMLNAIHTVEQAETTLSLPVLAAVPKTSRSRKNKRPHVLAERPDSACAEAFRSLRISAHCLGSQADHKVVLFTSAAAKEGKTFCSMNFAISQAQAGLKTLVLDMDLRRPAVGESFGMAKMAPGVSNYIQSRQTLEELVLATNYPGLFILPAGTLLDSPAELLSSERMQQLLTEASQAYDCIVIDSAPINSVRDTFLLLPMAHLVFLVVRARKTSKPALLRTIDLMVRANHPPVGTVLNFMPKSAPYSYYYYYAQNDTRQERRIYRKKPAELANT